MPSKTQADIHEFFRACERGDVNTVSAAATAAATVTDAEGHTALQVAAANDQREVIRVLLAANKGGGGGEAAAAAAHSYGWTPLHHAAVHGHTEACELLLKHDSSIVNLKNRYGATPLNVATAGGHLSTVK